MKKIFISISRFLFKFLYSEVPEFFQNFQTFFLKFQGNLKFSKKSKIVKKKFFSSFNVKKSVLSSKITHNQKQKKRGEIQWNLRCGKEKQLNGGKVWYWNNRGPRGESSSLLARQLFLSFFIRLEELERLENEEAANDASVQRTLIWFFKFKIFFFWIFESCREKSNSVNIQNFKKIFKNQFFMKTSM